MLAPIAWTLLRTASGLIRRVEGSSMRPTLRPGDLVLVVPTRHVGPGDVVVVRDPRAPGRETVKRVAPGGYGRGDRVAGGHGEGTIVVLGDDPDASTDSRTFGPVPLALVVGRVLVRVWPPGRLSPPPQSAP